jgi:hypothetical protein
VRGQVQPNAEALDAVRHRYGKLLHRVSQCPIEVENKDRSGHIALRQPICTTSNGAVRRARPQAQTTLVVAVRVHRGVADRPGDNLNARILAQLRHSKGRSGPCQRRAAMGTLTLRMLTATFLAEVRLDSRPCLRPTIGAGNAAQRHHGIHVRAGPVLPLPFSRASTTNLLALSTLPLPIGRPCIWHRAY